MKKISFAIFLLGIFFVTLSFVNFVSAQTQSTYCAEKTIDGAWCQNVLLDKVDQSFRYVPTSCEATSYCKLGTCVNNQEGICMENTPEIVCEQPQGDSAGGVWFDAKADEIPQCSLGCCLVGDQAAFTTQVRCIQLSSLYGLETNYRTDIKNEAQCIATATSGAKGACVFERDFQRTCRLTTQSECTQISSQGGSSNAEFHEGFLCSAGQLATNCGPSEKTTIIEGRDEVFFADTCGNVANIYDANRQNDQTYWEKIVSKAESCGFNSNNGNAGSAVCGNCDYFLGSTGKAYDRTLDSSKPRYGDYICRDLSCDYQGETYKHGETWCEIPSENGKNLPGDRYFRNVCYNGEVTVEPCSDFRQDVCLQDDIDGFRTAACRVNKWQDCVAQEKKLDCENEDKRDCSWILNDKPKDEDDGKCTPKFAPGFDFWQASSEGVSDAESLCAVADNKCTVVFEKGLLGGWECKQNCECLTDKWKEDQSRMCVALGDCGVSTNYIGQKGYYTIKDLITKQD